MLDFVRHPALNFSGLANPSRLLRASFAARLSLMEAIVIFLVEYSEYICNLLNKNIMSTNQSSAIDLSLIRHATWIGFYVNAMLMVLKIVVGLYGHSDALVADGVHSMSDFATDLIVLIFVGIAYKSADSEHPYGHGKFETFATMIIGAVLIAVGIGIGMSGFKTAKMCLDGKIIARPDVWTLIVAMISIGAKELLYRYTIVIARKVDSTALRANAWHHRSDAISSIATLVGVGAAYFLGDKWIILDPIAAMLIAVFIIVSAIQICRPAIDELLDKSLSPDQTKDAEEAIMSVEGVRKFHRLRTHRNGHIIIIDVHIKVDSHITVEQGHCIATTVEDKLKAEFGPRLIANIHVEPFMRPNRNSNSDNCCK